MAERLKNDLAKNAGYTVILDSSSINSSKPSWAGDNTESEALYILTKENLEDAKLLRSEVKNILPTFKNILKVGNQFPLTERTTALPSGKNFSHIILSGWSINEKKI